MFHNYYEKIQTTLEHGRHDTEESAEFWHSYVCTFQGYNFKVFAVVKIYVVVFWVTTQFYASEGCTMCQQGCPDVRMLTYLGLQSPFALMLVMQKICGSNLG